MSKRSICNLQQWKQWRETNRMYNKLFIEIHKGHALMQSLIDLFEEEYQKTLTNR